MWRALLRCVLTLVLEALVLCAPAEMPSCSAAPSELATASLLQQHTKVAQLDVAASTSAASGKIRSRHYKKAHRHHRESALSGLHCVPSELSGLNFSSSFYASAVASPGVSEAWKLIASKLMSSKPLTLLILGGSVSTYPWTDQVCDWLKTQSPGSTCVNGAKGGAGSKWQFDHLERSGSYDMDIRELQPDVVLLDTGVNSWDGNMDWPEQVPEGEAFYLEQIVRSLDRLDSKALLLSWHWAKWGDGVKHATYTHENLDLYILNHYGLPLCSLRDAMYPLIRGGVFDTSHQKPAVQIGNTTFEITKDGLHPNELGGGIIVDTLTHFMCDQSQSAHEAPGWPRKTLPDQLMKFKLEHFEGSKDEVVPTGGGHYEKDLLSSVGNATARSTDVMILLSGLALFGWESLCASSAMSSTTDLSSPARTRLNGHGIIRSVGLGHIAIMHFYQLQPERIQNASGFPSWARWGKFWVQMFFLLSGFVLYLSESSPTNGSQQEGYSQRFLARRVRALYPTFALSLILVLGCSESRSAILEHPEEFILTVFWLQTWIRPGGMVLMNGPSWYLSVLLVFFIAFPRWLQQVRRMRYPVACLALLWAISFILPTAVLTLSFVVEKPIDHILDDGLRTFVDFNPACCWHIFLFGMVLARVFSEYHSSLSERSFARVSASVPVAVLTAVFICCPTPGSIAEAFLNKGPILLPVFASLILGLACEQDVIFGLPVWTRPIFSTWLPGCSWCLYILHVPIFYFLHKQAEHWSVTQPYVANAFVWLLVSLVIAAAVHSFFDEPIRRHMTARSAKL